MDLVLTGKTIAKLRKEAGFTQASLAAQLGISDKAISKWERGIAFPDVSLLNKLSILLDTDIESLLYGHEQSSNWIGVLFLDDSIDADTIIYNKPLIHYLISQFLLVGIKEIVVIGKCKPIEIKGINITITDKLNQQFTKHVFAIYGNRFIYGPNLTKHFMRAMSRDVVTVIASLGSKGEFPMSVDSEKNGSRAAKAFGSQYYAQPFLFNADNMSINQFECNIGKGVKVETLSRGMICFNINDYESVYEMAGFVKMMERNTGERIADLDEIIKIRKL